MSGAPIYLGDEKLERRNYFAFAVVSRAGMFHVVANNTPHASRKIGAPWGVTFSGGGDAFR